MTAFLTGIGWINRLATACGREQKDIVLTKKNPSEIKCKSIFRKPFKRFGRMDEFSKIGLSGIALALRDAGIDKWEKKRNIGIIASTTYGCLHTDLDYFETVVSEKVAPSPLLFSYTLPNCFIGEAAIRFGLSGSSFIINQETSTGIKGLQMALLDIQFDRAEKMIFGVCDMGCPINRETETKVYPGAVFIVIEKIRKKKMVPYGRLRLDMKGTITFNNKRVKDMVGLVQTALNAYHSRD